MTRSTSHRGPGSILLVIARVVFDASIVASVVEPTIADLQAEAAAAGRHRLRRAFARLRGYAAFWTLVLLAPFAASAWPARKEGSMTLSLAPATRRGGLSIWLVMAGVLGFTSPAMTSWTATVLAGGLVFAVAMHLWYSRHPLMVATPNGQQRPEINLSRIPVGGNIGGLIFMAGSMGILVAGLPGWRWFFGAAVVGGVLTATLVYAWHTLRPAHGLPENLIHLR
jgi:hypothetical protein